MEETPPQQSKKAAMATLQVHPPHKLPGLDEFLTRPTSLRNVAIASDEHGSLHISATTKGLPGRPDVPLAILRIELKPGTAAIRIFGPTVMAVSVGDRIAPYNDGAVEADDLGLDRSTLEGAILWAAYVELREAYRDANRILDAYLDQYRAYTVTKIGNSIASWSKAPKTVAPLLTNAAAGQ